MRRITNSDLGSVDRNSTTVPPLGPIDSVPRGHRLKPGLGGLEHVTHRHCADLRRYTWKARK